MIEHLIAPQNLPFAVALLMTLGLGALEIVTAFFGAALSGALDSALPDLDLDADLDVDAPGVDAGVDAGAGADAGHGVETGGHGLSGLGRALDWLHVGRVPTLLLLLGAMGSFGGFGLLLQSFAQSWLGALAPSWMVAVPAGVLSLVSVRAAGGLFARFIPKEETSAVSHDSFLGMPALVTGGVATLGNPAQAKLRDEHGQTHYMLVEPEAAGIELPTGATVILTRRDGAVFKAVKNDVPELMLDADAR